MKNLYYEEQTNYKENSVQVGHWKINHVQHKLLWCSKEFYQISGIEYGQFDGNLKPFLEFMHPDDKYKIENANREIDLKKDFDFDFRLLNQNNDVKHIRLIGKHIAIDGHNNIFSGTILDTSEQKELENQLFQTAYFDMLTGLPNRAHLNKYLENVINHENDQSFSLILIRLSNYYDILENFGEDRAVKCIEVFIEKLKESLVEGAFLAKVACHEFAIVSDSCNELSELVAYCKYINLVSKDVVLLDHYNIFAKVNIGAVMSPADGDTDKSLITNARLAVRDSEKHPLKNYQIFSSSLDINNYKNFDLRNDMTVINDFNQFNIFFQPIVDVENNCITNVEALLRWEHPKWGIVSPDIFIQLAEETGSIVELSNWLLQKIVQHIVQWKSLCYPDVKVHLNISPILLISDDFYNATISLVNEHPDIFDFIVFEITEGVDIFSYKEIIPRIHKLQALGIDIALDDYGSGYSHLKYLKALRPQILKMDMSLIQHINDDKINEQVVKYLIQLCNKIGVKIIAEGIENEEELDKLIEFGCQYMQGYYFSKPMPTEMFENVLKSGLKVPLFFNNTNLNELENDLSMDCCTPRYRLIKKRISTAAKYLKIS